MKLLLILTTVLTLTFDDGLSEHVTTVMPLLDSLGLKGTFYLIPRNIDRQKEVRGATTCTWEQSALLLEHGHRIGNHTYAHRNLTDLSIDDARREIEKGDSAIFAHLGVHPTELAFPGNKKSDSLLVMVKEMGLSPREVQQSFGGKRAPTVEAFRLWLDKQVKKGADVTTMTHGITVGFDAFAPDTVSGQSALDIFRECLIIIKTYEQEGKIEVK